MKISFSWLQDYLKTTQTPAELAETLVRSGIEVTSITSTGSAATYVVAAQILSSEQHPNADRLSICQVDDGSQTARQIVCGAKNYHVGDKILLALPGAVLPGGINIKVGKLRGVESEGMMCSAQELGLSGGEGGLYILPPETVSGTELNVLFPSDTILELEITPNRPDWLGHIGIAREAAAFGAGDFLESPVVAAPSFQNSLEATIMASNACSFYSLRLMEQVNIAKSPLWLSRRLESIGLRSINNIVDITNYVMMETGQPLHAFDADKIKGIMTVRFAEEGETLEALDGNSYLLRSSDLVIADAQGVQALAGIIGGIKSSVTEKTTSVFLESAVFHPSTIRASAFFHGLRTDASYRFERGMHAAIAMKASTRAASLMLECAGAMAKAQKQVVMMGALSPRAISLRYDRCRELLGISLPDKEISSLLEKIGCLRCQEGWQVPDWRLDVTREIDLIEEVVRLHGIESIKARYLSVPSPSSATDRAYDAAMLLRRRLIASGFYEVRTSLLVSPEESSSGVIPLRNPIGEQQSTLRTSLLSGLKEVVKHNLYQGAASLKLFEIGKTFHLPHASNSTEEISKLSLIMTGQSNSLSWRGGIPRSLDLYDLKGALDHLLPGKITYSPSMRVLPPTMAIMLHLVCDAQYCGYIGCLSPAESRKLMVTGQDDAIVIAELDLSVLLKHLESCEHGSWKNEGELSKFPSITRDMAIIVDKSITYAQLEQELLMSYEAGESPYVREPLLKKMIPLDVFTDPTGEKIAVGKKSVTLELTFQAENRTLTAQEVNTVCNQLIEKLNESFDVALRS